ncbi:hypothetical protein WR25_06232 [Diploscapter pachys]|uniref:Uncharacterized protein n=1 Tax=Diploscapter pachys TaxID=2018661 RepID=A0A2A2M0P7_9BILA|nr:hypothetical protein WR25_06232 [Diploscapter pachys]
MRADLSNPPQVSTTPGTISTHELPVRTVCMRHDKGPLPSAGGRIVDLAGVVHILSVESAYRDHLLFPVQTARASVTSAIFATSI